MNILRTERTNASLLRDREMETGRLVCRAVRARLDPVGGGGWLIVRAQKDVARLAAGPARQALGRAVGCLCAAGPDLERLAAALVSYGGLLERHRQRTGAVEAFEAALAVRPEDPELMLHAARSHRKAGNREAARALYGRVRERGSGRLARFSSLGEALLAESPEEPLRRVQREAESAGDAEVVAVALEERAAIRRARGAWREAVDDLTRSALRYEDRRDRLRVAHALADLLLARGELDGAREALGAAVELAAPGESDHAVQRLRAIARAQGDQLGLRRWRPSGRAALVSLMPQPSGRRSEGPVAQAVRQWRDALTAPDRVVLP